MANYVCESSIILKVWRGDQWIVNYVWKLTLYSIIEKEDHCTDLYIYLFNTDEVHRLSLAAAAGKR